MGINDKPELFATAHPCRLARGANRGGCEVQRPEGFLSHSWLVRSAAACVFQPAGARLIHLIKTDLMIETETLFITLDFHTRHDSRLFHLRAFICRNEECVPIFKLNLPPPFFPLWKWFGMFLFCLFKFCFNPPQIGDVSSISCHLSVRSNHVVSHVGQFTFNHNKSQMFPPVLCF